MRAMVLRHLLAMKDAGIRLMALPKGDYSAAGVAATATIRAPDLYGHRPGPDRFFARLRPVFGDGFRALFRLAWLPLCPAPLASITLAVARAWRGDWAGCP